MPDEQDPQSVRTETTNEQVAAALARQSTLLRLVLERLDEVVQLLTPKPSEGPTLDQLLAGLVSLVSDQAVLLKRIDARTDLLVQHQLQPGDARPALNGAGANGTGDRR
ncbi:hypothetical protein QMO56_21570 [Roseomonas sp. E05]|uniref:hypothetical protein n=1 Tax=Roseomonas sp. E05 TaxID=3046310 RepID=UPI0024B8A9C0|nr:hypothetical protein [Roseomonas sp. E05]MDJ0390709.1 hypothetical protein [Roseomonas sp. E05]